MAIDDIVARIARDAEAEAAALLAEARADAERVVNEARARAEARAARSLARGRATIDREAATMLAGARLAARDQTLAERRALDLDVLARVEAVLLGLPDSEYAALLAREIAKIAGPGEVARIGSADAGRLRSTLPGALAAAGVAISIEEGPAGVERGVVLIGDRVRVEVSPAALVASRREMLESEADRGLFGAGE